MADAISREVRSRIMAAVKSKNTTPELLVRHIAHKLGYRFRLHRADLPGSPDLVFPRLRKVVFVNGCFWHAHQCVRGKRIPATNRPYWLAKRRRNYCRDRRVQKALIALGWEVLTIWECETKSIMSLENILRQFLGGSQLRQE